MLRIFSTTTDGGQFTLVGYSADISSAQDYYPFGMLMPGRYISDNSPQCITTQQTTLVPRTVRVYIDLTPAPAIYTRDCRVVPTRKE